MDYVPQLFPKFKWLKGFSIISYRRTMEYLNKFLDWHESQCYKFMDRFNLSEYHCMWLMFGEGFLLALLLVWIF